MSVRAGKVEATAGFEPANGDFAALFTTYSTLPIPAPFVLIGTIGRHTCADRSACERLR